VHTTPRFWGYDGALEVQFFVEDRVSSFDGHRARIFDVARRVYERRRKGSYELIASDFY